VDAQEVVAREHDYVLGVYGRAPFVLERGQGSTLFDSEGKAYIDCVAGIAVNALGYGDAGIQQGSGPTTLRLLNGSRPVGGPTSVEPKGHAHGKFNDR
jgi:acetylornithine/N-succinyldiaminopimelate aminotransferase